MKPLPKTPGLLAVAERVVWFKPPAEALADPVHFLAHVMTYGTVEDLRARTRAAFAGPPGPGTCPASPVLKSKRKRTTMLPWEPTPYKDYRWIVADPQLLGGTLAIRGTRLSVSLILECLASGMTLEDIKESFDGEFPPQALTEVLMAASELAGSFHVAA